MSNAISRDGSAARKAAQVSGLLLAEDVEQADPLDALGAYAELVERCPDDAQSAYCLR